MQILLDLGASFLKGYVVDGDLRNVIDSFQIPGLAQKQVVSSDSSFLEPFCSNIQAACTRYPVESVVIAEEMHGFSCVAREVRSSTFYSWRYSWNYKSACNLFFETTENFERATGLRARNGYGLWGLVEGAVDRQRIFGSLSSLLLQLLGRWDRKCDLSILHSQGVIDAGTRNYLELIYQRFEHQLPTINRTLLSVPIGEISCGLKRIPVYGGVGDLTATLDGIFHENVDSGLVVNSGTGSQIAFVNYGQPIPFAFGQCMEQRLGNLRDYFVVSHIPCGRAIEFFKRICLGLFPEKSETQFWEQFAKSETRTNLVLSSLPNIPSFSLGVFDTATVGVPGSINHLSDSVGFDDYILGLKASLISQYVSLIKTIKPQPDLITFAGGVFLRNQDLADGIIRELDDSVSASVSQRSNPVFGLVGYG